jgi:hypothetical protein
MPLPGGATDKFGNRYEGRWTVLCMVEVMGENADSIRLEPPGVEGEGVEFWLRRENNREYHQVKRQQSKGSWTLGDLTTKRVLPNFREKLTEATANCVFISSDRAFQLDELADRAKRSASFQEFESEFLSGSGQSQTSEQRKNFLDLCNRWNDCTQIEAYEALKKIRVETISEDLLRTTVENRLAALVDGESANIADVLAQFALDKVHHELTAYDIWHHLNERRFQRRMWGNDPHVLAKVTGANSLYQNPLRDSSIANQVIPRCETQTVLQKLISPSPTEKKALLVVGEAGVGKSGVMLQICDEVVQEELPFLAFRIDRLEPTLLPDKVGEQLGLPGSPASVLAAIAQKRACVLIIDQLDAVSLASGRNPQFFDCVFEIIKQVQALPNMRLVLACRKFDLDNDHRLRRLTDQDGIAETVQINRLPHATVQDVISTKLGLDSTRFNEKQLTLLSVPLHLNLLAEIAKNSEIDTLDFNTAKDLYDQFWDRKKALIRERRGDSVKWVEVIDKLCDYMSRKQTLSAPITILDDGNLTDDAQTMASEHVLTWSDNRIQFFHESFFDYAFARRFAAQDQTLLAFLLNSEQHLFRRAQIRQILIHQRESDFDGYLRNLSELLNSSEIRFHLKQTVFSLLATLSDPKEQEWEIIASLITASTSPLTEQTWRVLRVSVHWFNLLDSLGVIQQWLASSNLEQVNQTIRLLAIFQEQIPDRIVELLEPYIDVSEKWQQHLNNFFTRGYNIKPVASHKFFEFFLRFVPRGTFDHQQGDHEHIFWLTIDSLPETHPDWACEAIASYFNHHLELSLAAGQTNLFDYDVGSLPARSYDEKTLQDSARKAPETFVKSLLPFMFRVIEATADQNHEPPWIDPVWSYRTYGEGYGIQHALLSEIEVALSHMVVNSPEAFANLEQRLFDSNFETIQYLLIRAYTAGGERFADRAVNYLCQNPRRLETGYSVCRGNARAGEFWATYQMLQVVTPYCSQKNLEFLECTILNYYTIEEKSQYGRHSRGYAQLVLIQAIDTSRRSQIATLRLQEWQRKFISLSWLDSSGILDIPEMEDTIDIDDSVVKSPISNKSVSKMTDEQWLRAIKRYDKNGFGFYRSDSSGIFTGGAYQLSCELEKQFKIEPKRFANLIFQFPENSDAAYFNAVLRGLADAEIDVDTAFVVSRHCHQIPNQPCGRQISWLIGKLAHLAWSEEAFDILIWYALIDPDPNQELDDNSSNPLSTGINSTRGSAACAIAELLFADKNRIPYFQKALQQVVDDPSIAVRACAAHALIALLNYDRNLAIQLFIRLCNITDKLLGASSIERFLYYALSTHFQELSPILERMLTSDLPEVVKAGAKMSCLSFLVQQEAKSLAERCLSGSKDHRKAMARIFAVNLRKGYQHDFCEQSLTQLFNDSEQEVRSEAASCFAHFESSELGNHIDLVNKFIESNAFGDSQYQLLRALEKTTAKLPQIVIQVCERALNNKTNNMNHGIDMTIMTKLLLRVYSQDSNPSLQSQCLDIVDRMTQMGVYDLDQALQVFER